MIVDAVRTRRLWRRVFEWYQGPLGQELAVLEQSLLDDLLTGLFGYHLVQCGPWANAAAARASRITHRLIAQGEPQAGVALVTALDELPFAADSVDVLLLPHTLEFEPHPHQVLREVERVLVAEGHVVILGFNPLSLWGLVRLLARGRGAPWNGRFYTTTRVRDWLELLGLTVSIQRQIFFRPPWPRRGVLRRLQPLERWGARAWPLCGGVYAIVAQKRVSTLTPLRARWRRPQRLATGSLAKPTAG